MDIELILGNSNKRFSGVTSTMLQVLSEQKALVDVAVLGSHFVPEGVPTVSFWQLVRLCRNPLADGRCRIFHARRNDEMIQALVLKHLFGAKIKIVFTSTAQRYHSRFTRWLIRQMDGLVSTCEAAAKYLERKPEIIVPHGIDIETYRPAENRELSWESLGLPGRYGLGIFGRVRKQKGHDLLLEAALPLLKDYPDFTLVIIGQVTAQNQPFFQQLMDKVEQAGLSQQVCYMGELPFSEIPKLFRSMSIVAALSRNEGFGLTIPEAMGSGVAVLASEAGAWPEVVRNGVDGYIVPCGDINATSEALKRLMSDQQALEVMGANGRQRVEQHYTKQREAAALVEFFKTLQ